jgi:sugar lactone lactonase YvrE
VRAEQVTGPVAYHGEGPVWSERWGGLCWVDMLAGDVLSLAADGTIDRRHVGNVAAVLRPRRQGGAIIGVERGFALEDAEGTLTHLGEFWSDTNVRMNEGAAIPTAASTAGRWPTTSGRVPARCTGWMPTSPCTSFWKVSRSRTGSSGARMALAPTTTIHQPNASTSSTTMANPD